MMDFDMNDSLLEIAIKQMNKSNKPTTIHKLAVICFKFKGKNLKECQEEYAQFIIDFMLCGLFICCGEKDGEKLWDLKYRQKFEVLEKEDIDYEYYEDDEESDSEESDDDDDDDDEDDYGIERLSKKIAKDLDDDEDDEENEEIEYDEMDDNYRF